MTRPTNESIKDKLFELAETVLDDALRSDTPAPLRLESLKQVAALYLGNVRVTKGVKEEDSMTTTMDTLRDRINAVKE